MERNMYGVFISTQMSSPLTDPVDEKFTLDVVKLTLTAVSTVLVGARTEVNEVMGGCARQTQVAYDKAKSLLGLVDETNRIITPLLKRVEADINEPIKLPR
jgi:hypothetical protein